MRFSRAISAAATTLIVAGTITAIALPAAAVGGPSAEDYAAAARTAATAADTAFVDARWDDVRTQADAFTTAYRALVGLRADAAATLADLEDARDAAQATKDTAQGAYDGAVAQLVPLQAALDAANAAVVTAHAATVAAAAAAAAALAVLQATSPSTLMCSPGPVGVQCLPTPNPAFFAAQNDYIVKQMAATMAQSSYQQAQADATMKQSVLATQRAVLRIDSLRDALTAAGTDLDTAQARVDDQTARLAAIESLIAGLQDAFRSVADRRADLADLDTVTRTVVWTLGADNTTPRAGDTVKLTFTVPNSQLFALSGAAVRVATPHGITPACDIVGGAVAAGALVTCTATYVPTDADATSGKVVFDVELTGYLPLGPGNPRATAVSRTLFTATSSLTVPVAARAVTQAPAATGDELSQTGFDSAQLGTLAVAMLVAGGALLVARRRFADTTV